MRGPKRARAIVSYQQATIGICIKLIYSANQLADFIDLLKTLKILLSLLIINLYLYLYLYYINKFF